MLTAADWDSRYRLQASWTQELRQYAYRHANLSGAARILEAGCGTGAILLDFRDELNVAAFGIDIDLAALRLARRQVPFARLSAADALSLPFPDGAFDGTLCHYFLLWVSDPVRVLREMARVTRPGGALLVLAEPDYGGRIDYPPPLDRLGALQTESLAHQGADPFMGRKLAALLRKAGLDRIEHGVLNAAWGSSPSDETRQSEWQVLQADVKGMVSAADMDEYEQTDREAWQSGERVLFVPTFYAWGWLP